LSERRPPGVTEADVIRVLDGLFAAARIFRLQAQEAQPWIEVLAEDYGPAAVLLQSLVVAIAQRPMHLGTVGHLEHVAQEILRDLRA
jgi:hypothetical protein